MTITKLRLLAATAVLAGVVGSAAANAMTIVRLTDPTTGCTHEVDGPDYAIQSGPPGLISIRQIGGFGESVHCP